MTMQRTSVIVCLAFLAACATTPDVAFEGESSADRTLRSDVFGMVSLYTEAKGCATIEKVVTAVMSASVERWVAHGCGKEYPYTVTFTEDSEGGTFFAVSAI